VDVLVLGCTHYAFLRPLIAEVMGPGVELIDPADAVARQAHRMLRLHVPETARSPTPPRHHFFTTGDPWRFAASLERLVGGGHCVLRISSGLDP
jgi:glutamate racemase